MADELEETPNNEFLERYAAFWENFNAGLLDFPAEMEVTRAFMVYMATSVSDTSAPDRADQVNLAREIALAIGHLEYRVLKLEGKAPKLP